MIFYAVIWYFSIPYILVGKIIYINISLVQAGGMNELYTESSLKNIQFGTEIRNRNREQYLRKLRHEFLQLQ